MVRGPKSSAHVGPAGAPSTSVNRTRSKNEPRIRDRFVLRFPIVGERSRSVDVCRFECTAGTSSRSRVPALHARQAAPPIAGPPSPRPLTLAMRGGTVAFTVFFAQEIIMQTSRTHLARLYSRAHRGMTLLEIMIVLAILAIVMGIIVGPRVIGSFIEAKHKTTRLKLGMVAFQAYPAWLAAHPEKDCPDKLADLSPFMNNDDTNDEWGTPITMLCGANLPVNARGLAVISAGEDHKVGTSDDLHSWE